jgi:hypothetical protein
MKKENKDREVEGGREGDKKRGREKEREGDRWIKIDREREKKNTERDRESVCKREGVTCVRKCE